MTTQVQSVNQTLARGLGQMARRYLTGWRGLVVLASVAIAAGLALNWSWLVAAGIAPFLLSALPCVAMCALGLCMGRKGGQSCSAENTPSKTTDTTDETAPSAQILNLHPDRAPAGTAISVATEADQQANTLEQRRTTHA